MLASIREQEDSNIGRLIQDLLSTREDGRIKLFLIYRALKARKTNQQTFREGAYLPIESAGRFRSHVIAFARKYEQQWAVVIAPKFLSHLVQEGEFPLGREVWQDTDAIMPDRSPAEWRNALTSEVLSAGNALPVGDVLLSFPVALLMSGGKEAYVQTALAVPFPRCSRAWRPTAQNQHVSVYSSGNSSLIHIWGVSWQDVA